MRAFLAIALLCTAAAAAPRGGRTSALGGSVAARGAMTRPLGGFAPAAPRNYRPVARTYPYAYSWYVPNYLGWGDDSYYDSYYGAPAAAPPPAPEAFAAPQQPVIINQYFGVQKPPPQQVVNDPPQAAGDVIGTPRNYYLIAYRNHAVYSAIAYWVEDKTLHYVTTQNTHNQASLDLIDLELTKSLNQAHDVPFSIPGQ